MNRSFANAQDDKEVAQDDKEVAQDDKEVAQDDKEDSLNVGLSF